MSDWLLGILRWFAGDGQWQAGITLFPETIEPIAFTFVLNSLAVILFMLLSFDSIYWEKRTISREGARAIGHLRRFYTMAAIVGFGFPMIRLWWPAWRLQYVLSIWMLFEGAAYLRGRLHGYVLVYQDEEAIEALRKIKDSRYMRSELDHHKSLLAELQCQATAREARKSDAAQ